MKRLLLPLLFFGFSSGLYLHIKDNRGNEIYVYKTQSQLNNIRKCQERSMDIYSMNANESLLTQNYKKCISTNGKYISKLPRIH